MIKTIQIGEKDIQFNTSLSWMFKYRSQFGHDPLDVLMPAIKAAIPLVNIDGMTLTLTDLDMLTDVLGELELTEALQLIWSLAANADPSIGDPERWYAGFDYFPLDEVLVTIGPAIFQSCISTKKYKALSQSLVTTAPMKTEQD